LLGAPGSADVNDRQLLERFTRAHDDSAFEALVFRHGPLVWGVCRRVLNNDADAEDAFQASFLVLAQKASIIGWRESVGAWLYQVAYHVASCSRRAAARRRKLETQVPSMTATPPDTSAEREELRAILDDELYRLPEKYRMPLLLCCVHGKSREHAAAELGWTDSAVKGRLERGRELLRRRLVRRGLVMPAVAFAGTLTHEALAGPPPALVATTVQAAMSGAGTLTANGLMKGALQAMFLAKLRKAGLLAVMVIVVLGSGTGVWLLGRGSSTARAVPLPPVAEKAEGSSEPVEKNGLSVTVTPARRQFAYGDSLEFTVTLKNTTDKPFGICMVPFAARFGDWQLSPLFDSKLSYAIVLFKPGEERRETVKVEPQRYQFRWVGKQSRPVAPVQWLREGKYPLVVDLSYGLPPRADAKFAHPLWQGSVTTKPVEIEIVKADISWGEPRDGLRMGLSPARMAVGPDDEEIKVSVWYENVGTENRSVMVADEFRYPFGFVVTRDGKSSDVPCQLRDVKGVPAPRFVQLKPGAMHREEVVLRFGGDGKVGFVRLPRPTKEQPLKLTAYCNGEAKGKSPAPQSGAISIDLK
jgi:RNA polymerase sigma factor (sigma-70 family)